VTPLHRTKLGIQIDWGLVLFFLILAGACVARGQAMTGLGDIVSQHNDGCNTTTCYKSGLCSSTTAYCEPRARGALTFHAGLLASSICGKDDRNPTPNVDLVQVSCIDYDRLKAQAPQFPWPTGRVTQVLVHIRDGDAVRVTVDGVAKFADLIRDAWGRLIALVQFDGVDYTGVAVKVYRAVEE
jgi:hypothetical protein